MRHRHLTEDAGWSLPAIDDILDRGKPRDWAELGTEVLRDPYGEVAQRIVHVCKHHFMYGTSRLWTSFVALAQAEATSGK
jgi:hypothetical protein